MAKSEDFRKASPVNTPVDVAQILAPKGFAKADTKLTPSAEVPITRAFSKRKIRHAVALTLIASDSLAIAAAFAAASIIRLGHVDMSQFGPIMAAVLPIYLAIALNKGGYGPLATNDFGYSIRKSALAFLFATGSLLLIAFFLKVSEEFSRILLGIGTAAGVATLAAGRAAVARIGRGLLGSDPYASVLIADGTELSSAQGDFVIDANALAIRPDPTDRDAINRLGELTAQADRVVVHCKRADRQRWAFALKSLNLHAEIVVPELDRLAPLALSSHGGKATLLMSSDPLGLKQRLTKRLFDLAVVIAVTPILLPILALTAIAVRIESKGPALFKQSRIGIANRSFTIWKFRSMRTESSDANGNRSASRDDDRLTRVGAFIRRTSIDELPQLWNVLKGDMSIVGPRPHAVGSRAENLLFWDIDERYWHRHSVKPGLTGLAQIRGFRGSTEVREDVTNRLQADLEYVANWSLVGDIKIMLQTFGVISHQNAY